MAESNTHGDVSSLLYKLIMLFRETYQSSPAEALIRFNYTKVQAEKILSMSLEQVEEFVGKGIVCFNIEVPASPLRAV